MIAQESKTVSCSYCGSDFSKPLYRIREYEKMGWRVFCSDDCQWSAKRTSVEVRCSFCGELFLKTPSEVAKSKTGNSFCSKGCAVSYNNSTNPKRKALEKTLCEVCSSPVKTRRARVCSSKCRGDKIHKDYIDLWKAGLESGSSSSGVHRQVRRYLFERHGHSCSDCGWSAVNAYTGLIPLTVHHVDGDWTNNVESNLQLLCPNCHSLTPNFGSRNKASTKRKDSFRS